MAAGKTAVTAMKLNGSSLDAGWTSREMSSSIAPMIVNGVVFAVAAGSRATNAVLYALDGLTGKELWNSGKSVASVVTSGGLSAVGGQVYLGTQDGTMYAFGFPMEH